MTFPTTHPRLHPLCKSPRRLSAALLLACLCAALLIATAPVTALAVTAPAGNELPEPDPVGAESLRGLADPASPYTGTDETGSNPHADADADMAALTDEVMSPQAHRALARAVDLSEVRQLAVFDNGRVKTLETLAQEQIERIYGRSQWRDPETGRRYDPVFTYLDLVFNHRYYLDKPVVHIEVLPLQRELLAALELSEEQESQWVDGSRVSPMLLEQPAARDVLEGRGADLRFFDAQQQVRTAVTALRQVGQRMLMVSPPPGQDQWAHLADLADPRLAEGQPIRVASGAALAVDSPQSVRRVNGALYQLAMAWRAGEPRSVNGAMNVLTDWLPRLNPQTYPPRWRLTLEGIYNATHKFTIGYVAYLIGAIALLIAFAVGRRWIITTGVAFAVLGFVVHTGGMIVRGVLSGRWPIHNQFESFIALTWFAVAIGLVLMLARKQWLFGAAAAALGTCALLLANVVDIPSNEMARDPGILATSNILYIHVNMVLVSYALIALAFFISLIYLGVHYFGAGPGDGPTGGSRRRDGAADGAGGDGGGGLGLVRFAAVGLGHEVGAPVAAGVHAGKAANASAETAAMASSSARGGGVALARGRESLLRDLDKAQLIVMQLAFWTLGAGVLLGAYWADHAWGRWWGWDPKEVWALITWIVYLVAIHARFGVKRRGLVTAWLSVLGFIVMLWTYWGVNLLLAGLHSYA